MSTTQGWRGLPGITGMAPRHFAKREGVTNEGDDGCCFRDQPTDLGPSGGVSWMSFRMAFPGNRETNVHPTSHHSCAKAASNTPKAIRAWRKPGRSVTVIARGRDHLDWMVPRRFLA